jgi:hypothetical protein
MPSADNFDFHYKTLIILLFTFVLNLTSVAYAQTAPPLSFVPVTPCRIADTRNAAGPFGGPALAANGTRSFVIPSSDCNIPTTALAYALNFTVVPQNALSYLTVWPTGESQPLVSTLNSPDGRIKANAAIMPAGTGGAISVYATDETQVIIDISGYFVANISTSALAFFALPPCRVVDTRNADAPLGGPFLTGGQERDFPVLTSSCGVPSYAEAYSLNFTVVPHVPLGFLTVWPTGESQPLVSTLNALTGTVTANAAIVPAGSGGDISTYVTNSTDLVMDINGYFAPASYASQPLWLQNIAPCRVLDTRTTGATLPLTVAVAGTCSVPSGAQAYVFNATVVPQGPLYFLTLWPQGTTQPLVSTLNALDGFVTSNMAIVPTSNGEIQAAASGSTALVLDINGLFAPAIIDLSGTWQGDWLKGNGTTGTVSLSLVETGSAITGSMTVTNACFTSGTVSGTVSGSQINLTILIAGGGELTFSGGTVNSDGNSMTGTVAFSGGCSSGKSGGSITLTR